MDILQSNKPEKKIHGWLSLYSLSKITLLLFILLMPFVSAFSFTGTLSLPLIFGAFLFGLMCIYIVLDGRFPKGFIGFDILIIALFFFIVLFSYIVNGLGVAKSLNHSIAFFSTFSVFYVAIKFAFFRLETEETIFKQVLFFITVSTVFNGLYGSMEFISANAFDINFNDYIPRPNVDEEKYNASVIGLFTRTRGFASESGAYTQMMELFAPLSIYYMFFSGWCKWPVWLKAAFLTLITFGVIFAASTATFIVVPVAIFIAMLVYIKKIASFLAKKNFVFYLKTVAITGFVILVSEYFSIYASIVLSITDKADSSSLDDRTERLDFFYAMFSKADFIEKLIGRGPAASDILGYGGGSSILSLYYGITFQLGLIGLGLILLLFLYFLVSIFFVHSKFGFFLLIAFLSGVMHYYIMNNYWVPWFWFLCAFAVYYHYLYMKQKTCNDGFPD